MSAKARIVGWSHIPFGKLIEPDTESLMARVSVAAMRHAGVGSEAVDGIYVGVMNNGFQKQDFQGALVALADERLAHTPATRLEKWDGSKRVFRCTVTPGTSRIFSTSEV